MGRLHSNTTPFCIGLEYLWILVSVAWSWNQTPVDTNGGLYSFWGELFFLISSLFVSYVFTHCIGTCDCCNKLPQI